MVLQTNSPQEATEMLTKTRTTIIALIAASSFAGASVGRGVSAGDTINHYRTATTKEAVKKQVVGGVCGGLGQRYEEFVKQLDLAHREEDAEGIKHAREKANEYLAAGYELGCGFAS